MWSFSSSTSNLLPTLTFLPKLNQTSYSNPRLPKPHFISCCSDLTTSPPSFTDPPGPTLPPPVLKKRRRYRKLYPGEKEGITEEMRFVAMKLRESAKAKPRVRTYPGISEVEDKSESESEGSGGEGEETWQPTVEGFVKYLVDSKLVFDFVERIVDESSHVSYAYFRKTGLERSVALSKDLEWFSQQDIVIPEASNPGVAYVKYLEELAETSPPLFLCHFYNIYFSHIAGGQVIGKQVSEKILESKQLEFYNWEGESEELLRGVREKLNMLGEHWSRDEKNKCLREATKAFRYLGQIIRLIIL
ncbi:hypothetical protein DCAR_0522267 [Daucus carota subsp. sativus]|uniref:Inactive heme oxygenase 2, chloroplastic n=1 Tax=Daucus carota subsp. sativus TaxID=79200 RepID=A0A162A4T6_DAUCS|nr:PREDICTED: probable inactive heme oxygenase 2, chloroplastic [Daucus carota subsp. sativus]WOH02877.1 hypothetical protein DCAR_0522267 [Daucus carota subsp. sativus]